MPAILISYSTMYFNLRCLILLTYWQTGTDPRTKAREGRSVMRHEVWELVDGVALPKMKELVISVKLVR
jgi:hypothetical protein